MALRLTTTAFVRSTARLAQFQDVGRGAGRGGGGGGSIRDAGGAFGKMEAAREDEYFHKLQQRQIIELRQSITEEMELTKVELKKQAEALENHKKRLEELENYEKARNYTGVE